MTRSERQTYIEILIRPVIIIKLTASSETKLTIQLSIQTVTTIDDGEISLSSDLSFVFHKC